MLNSHESYFIVRTQSAVLYDKFEKHIWRFIAKTPKGQWVNLNKVLSKYSNCRWCERAGHLCDRTIISNGYEWLLCERQFMSNVPTENKDGIIRLWKYQSKWSFAFWGTNWTYFIWCRIRTTLQRSVGWNFVSIPKPQWLHCWRLGMDG